MEFICRMKDYMTRSVFIAETVKAVGNHFVVKPVDLDVDAVVDDAGFVHSTRLLEKQELEEASLNESIKHVFIIQLGLF